MSDVSVGLADTLRRYILRETAEETPLMARLRAETESLGDPASMIISPEQGRFMAVLARLTGTRRALEVGTFTGYSALSVALALPPDGHLDACDVSAEWTAIASRYWAEAGCSDRITLHLAPALETLVRFKADGVSYDFAFVDADKPNYPAYFEACLALLRPGGVLLFDNMLWGGAVADPERTDPSTEAIRATTRLVMADARVDACLLPVGDGVLMAVKL